MPRYVSLKGKEGNARRGPGLTHRIDWVFVRAGMPLRITGEYEHWRRIEDAEGAGGWVHFALLSGVRSAQVVVDLAEFHDRPEDDSVVSFKAEKDVIGWIQECAPDWCRLSIDGEKGWVRKTALWGVDPGEIVE
ncbi:MAG: aspartyl-trna synthetase [Rhodobacteraceae bacterium PARR1]|nr:MAG: aspartyl-trna synthetase [Rhodobacteraceae bacterium PARR1]